VCSEHVHIARRLLAHDRELLRDEKNMWPILECSARARSCAMLELLCENGLHITDTYESQSILHVLAPLSMKGKHLQVLSRHGSQTFINQQNATGATALLLAVDADNTENVLELLETSECNANTADFAGRTPMLVAAMNGRTPLVKILFAHGSDLTDTTFEGKTAQQWAAHGHHHECVLFLCSLDGELQRCQL